MRAFVFSGQGSQYAGMGKDLYDTYAIVRETFMQANEILGYDIRPILFEENAQLHQTRYTQPAIFVLSVAIYRLLQQADIKPDVAAGLSLGEYSALVAGGALSFEQGLQLLSHRARLMDDVSKQCQSKMVAVMNAERQLVEDVCTSLRETGQYVAPANYNMPGQIVIAGETTAVEAAEQLLAENGVKRCLPLSVSGPFHTHLLDNAAIGLAPYLNETVFQPLNIPVISNTYAKNMQEMVLADVLKEQVVSPVYWQDSVEEMIRLGVTCFVEIGPKKVLSKFIKKINKDVQTLAIDSVSTYQEALDVLQEEIS